MAPFSRAGVLLGLVGGVTLGSAPRHASAEEPTPFRVESSPGTTCPSGDPFATQLLRRTDRIREAVGDERAVLFRLEVAPSKNHTSGRLTVRELDGSEMEREVAGATCQEVVSAMVLIAAILVDPNASLEPLPTPPTPPAPPPPPPPPPPPRSTAPNAPSTRSGTVVPAGRTPPPGAIVRPRATIERDARRDALEGVRSQRGALRPSPGGALGRLAAGAGVGFALEGAPMPKLAAGIAVLGVASLERNSILSPLLEGSLVRTQTVRVDTFSGRAEFGFSSLRLLACPLRFPTASDFAVRPCVLGELGELVGVGKVTELPELVEARWVALGGALRLGMRLLGPLALAGQGALIVPLIRHEFYFDPHGPETTALDVPPVGASARFGVVAEFE